MVPNDIWLRTEWLSCRRTSVLRCVERYCAAAAREYRRALRRVQEVEETMAQVEPETGRRLPSQPAQAELLNRRLAAANAEIRRYQTRLYACEREMVALRQENAELEALCEQARANSLLPPVPPQPKVLEQPGLPVIVFHPAADAPQGRAAPAGCCTGAERTGAGACPAGRTAGTGGGTPPLCAAGLEAHHGARPSGGGSGTSTGKLNDCITKRRCTNAVHRLFLRLRDVTARRWCGVP